MDVTCEVKVEYSFTSKETKNLPVDSKNATFEPRRSYLTAKYHISVKLLLNLIWLKVSSAFNLGQRQQWNFPSLSCDA